LSPIWTFPLQSPDSPEGEQYGCCAGSGCPYKDFDNGWARPEFRQWVMENLPEALRSQWSGAEPQGGVQGPSFVASADALMQLRETGVFKVRVDEEWMQQSSERLLAVAFKILGHEPSQCSIEGPLFHDWFAFEGGECHPHPYRNPIVQPGRTRRSRFFTKTFGVIPGRKWRKVYLVSEYGMRGLLYAEWRRSPEYATIAKQLAAPSEDGSDAPAVRHGLSWTVGLNGTDSLCTNPVLMPAIGIVLHGTTGHCHNNAQLAFDNGFRRIDISGSSRACSWAAGRALAASGSA
jgi:hypothetical protein